MGQYYRFINLDKKQKCERNRHGYKLTEHSYLGNYYCRDILSLLSNEWKGDKVIHVGDYAEGNDGTTTEKLIDKIEQENNLLEDKYTVYHWGDTFEDIKPKKLLTNIRYVYNLDKKEFIDLLKQPIQSFGYEKNKIYTLKFDAFALLIGCGNEQGGGDYRTKNKNKIGLWAGNRFVASPSKINEYDKFNEIKLVFTELLTLKNRIKNYNEQNEKSILYEEGVELKHFLDHNKEYYKIDLSKVELDKSDLTEKEFNYLNNYLNKYKKHEINKEKFCQLNNKDVELEEEFEK